VSMDKITRRTDDERRQFCLRKGIDPSQHCCLDMAWFISSPVEWDGQPPNPVIQWISSWNEYRIEISHSGTTAIRISYCPWCGTRLPAPKADLWFETLYKLGYGDPGNDDIPEEFQTDRWWRTQRA